jgi:hypothetical protein
MLNRFASLGNLDVMWTSVGLGQVLENTKVSATGRLGFYELKQYKIWIHEQC